MGRGEVSKIKGNIAEPLYSGLEYPGLTTPYCFIQAVTLKLISYIIHRTSGDFWNSVPQTAHTLPFGGSPRFDGAEFLNGDSLTVVQLLGNLVDVHNPFLKARSS